MSDKLQFVAGWQNNTLFEVIDKLKFVGHFHDFYQGIDYERSV
jgi:hypothetical protein